MKLTLRNCKSYLLAGLLAGALGVAAPLSGQEAAGEIADLAQALHIAKVYEYGESGAAMEFIRAEVLKVQGDPEARNALAHLLAAPLGDADTTDAYRVFACRQLYLIGGEAQIDALAPLLLNPRLAHVARYALEVIADPRVDTLLWEAIPRADPSAAAGLVSSLAARGGAGAVTRLSALLPHENADVVTAALVGLGRMGGPESEIILRQGQALLPDAFQTEIFEALLACADGYAHANYPAEASRLYRELAGPELPLPVRLAALHGVVGVEGEASVPLIQAALASGDAPWVAAACGHVREVGGVAATGAFGAQLALLDPEAQVLLIGALADRGDPLALRYVVPALGSPKAEVQLAALESLGDLGNETHVDLLLGALLHEDPAVAEGGRAALARLADAGVNGALILALDVDGPEVRVAIMDVLAERRATEALPRLLRAAAEDEGTVRTAAFKAMGQLARREDVPALYKVFTESASVGLRAEASRALAATFRRIPAGTGRTELLSDLYDASLPPAAKGALLEMYRELGDDALLPLVLRAGRAPDAEEAQFAFDVLAGWPTAAPMDRLLALATSAEDRARRNAALAGYIRMLRLPSDLPAAGRAAGFARVLALTEDGEIVRAALPGLAELDSEEALELAEGLLTRDGVRAEAAIAAERIRRHFYRITASSNGDDAPLAADGDIGTRWESASNQEPGQWIEIDMSRPARIRGVVLDASRSPGTYPRSYEVFVYSKGGKPGEAVARGAGEGGVTRIEFAPVAGQMVRIVQTGSAAGAAWAIHEMRVIPD